MLSVSKAVVREQVQRYQDTGGSDGIPAYRIGPRILRFDPIEVMEWLKKRRAQS